MDREALGVTLTGESPPEGGQMLRALADAGLSIAAACWGKIEGRYGWFVVVSPTVEALGKQEAYRKAILAMDAAGIPPRRQGVLTLASPSGPVGADLLKLRASAGPEGGEMHASWVTLGGTEVEDVYIYPNAGAALPR